jgi:hypothetical protein
MLEKLMTSFKRLSRTRNHDDIQTDALVVANDVGGIVFVDFRTKRPPDDAHAPGNACSKRKVRRP